MKHNIHSARFSAAYNILCSPASPPHSRNPLYPTFCLIPVGGKTILHSHFEAEIFFLVSGQGVFHAGKTTQTVGPGDLLEISPFTQHELENSGKEELLFLSVYSEDGAIPRLPTSALVTAAPPTPNGPLHLGHISGPYLAADVLRRYLLQRGVDVRAESGTDDHQNYVDAKALREKRSIKNTRNLYRRRILAGLEKMGIAFDSFPAFSQKELKNRTLDFFSRALANGVLQEKKLALPYCEACVTFLLDANLPAKCPNCGQASHGGCEACGHVALPSALLQPQCGHCGAPASSKEKIVHTFALSHYLSIIAEDLHKISLPPRLRALVNSSLAKKDLEVLVTHPDGAGLPVGNGLHLHVWGEMAAHYESYALSKRTWIHSFGFDNSLYYLLFIPALLRALHPNAKLPNIALTNEFLQLEGKKFSTSRNHAIWADEFYGNPDHLRFFLSLKRPAEQQENFSQEEFSIFSQRLERTVQSLLPIPTEGKGETSLLPELNRYTRDLEKFYSPHSLDLRRAAARLLEMLDWIVSQDFCSGNRKLALQAFATLAWPIAPDLSRQLSPETNPSQWITDWVKKL